MLTLLTGRGNLSLSVYKMGVKIITPHLRELFWGLNELTHKKSSEWCVAEWGNAHWALAVAAAGLWGPTLKECACSVMYNSSVAPWTVALQAPLSLGFSRQECWSELPFPPLGDLPNPGIKPASLASPALAGGFFTTEPLGKPILKGQEELNIELPCEVLRAIPFLCVYPKELGTCIRIPRDTCTPIFIPVLFTVAEKWKQLTCPLAHEWTDRLWHMHTVARNSATERGETSPNLDVPWKQC